MAGFIKLDRKMVEWEWYKDSNTKVLFLHMLFKANWKDASFMGTEVKRGSFVSSIKHLSLETGVSERSIRTAISHLKMTGEVTSNSTNKFTVFTINNYDTYQTDDRQSDTQVPIERQATDKQPTTIEEVKKERSKEVKKKDIKNSAFQPPTKEDVSNYCEERKNGVDAKRFIDFHTMKGWMVGKNKMKDWKAGVRTWEKKGGTKRDTGRKTESTEKTYSDELREFANQFTGEFEGF